MLLMHCRRMRAGGLFGPRFHSLSYGGVNSQRIVETLQEST